MSDFVYSSLRLRKDILSSSLCSIYPNSKSVLCTEYHGNWGSIAAIDNHYCGYKSFEDSKYIMIITGSPILNFSFNTKFKENDNYKSQAILNRWKYEGTIKWEDDLSGPFAIICIDKTNNSVELVSDLLLFIPIYHSTLKNSKEKVHVFGTHNDVVARAAQREADVDFTSVADMLLNTAIVFPYTFHKAVSQLLPASVYKLELNNPGGGDLSSNTYWIPFEQYPYKDINEAAECLRESLLSTVAKITDGLSEVALFLSGGEDSRCLLASLPPNIKKQAFIFLDFFNREGRIARQVAKAYGANLNVGYRKISHYLDIMEPSVQLIGSQFLFNHCHAHNFHESYNLMQYSAVFDGIFANAFLKGYTLNSVKSFKLGKHTFYSKLKPYAVQNEVKMMFENTGFLNESYLEEAYSRRQNHFNLVSNFRDSSLLEWFELWPMTNLEGIASHQNNFKLFRCYIPYASSGIVKISASIPQEWKLNRRLFHLAFKPLFKKSWYISHGENADYPYFGIYSNIPLKIFEATKRKITASKQKDTNQGPWCRWNDVIKTDVMKCKIDLYSSSYSNFINLFTVDKPKDLFEKDILNSKQQLILLQVLYKAFSYEKKMNYAIELIN